MNELNVTAKAGRGNRFIPKPSDGPVYIQALDNISIGFTRKFRRRDSLDLEAGGIYSLWTHRSIFFRARLHQRARVNVWQPHSATGQAQAQR